MDKNLNKKEISDKLIQKIDSSIKRLEERKKGIKAKPTMLDLLYNIENTASDLKGISYELTRIRKQASPLSDTEQMLFDAYKDIDSNGFEGGGGLNQEQADEYMRLRKILDK